MIASLPELILPLTERDFRDHLRERSPIFRRSRGENRFGELLNWAMLRNLIETGVIPPDQFAFTASTRPLPATFYLKDGKIDVANFNGLLNKNVSLVTKPIERYLPALNVLCADVAARLGENVGAAVVATSGDGGALELHFDAPDVLVLQIEGSKRWRIYDRPVDHPIKGMHRPDPPRTQPIFDDILRPGDMLLVPGGYWHQCDNDGADISLHLSLLITAPTAWHAMRSFMPKLLSEDAFRVPLSRFTDEAAKAAHEAALKEALIEKIKAMPLLELASKGLERSVTHTDAAPAQGVASK